MSKITGIYGIWRSRLPGEQIKGIGKTMCLVYYGYKAHIAGQKVYCNVDTSFTEKLTTNEVYEMFKDKTVKNTVILLDEIQKDLPAIAPKVDLLKDFCDLCMAQTRKKGTDLIWTAQRAMDVNIKLREQSDILLRPLKVHHDGRQCIKSENRCERTHYIDIYSEEPHRIKPIKRLNCDAVGRLYKSHEMLLDRLGDTA